MKETIKQNISEDMNKWIDWVVELQSLAQAGLFYSKEKFDIERFQRIQDIVAEMVAYKTNTPSADIKALFCNETGYQTPKLDTRAAIFDDNKILLVQENDGLWSLPGGWVDVDLSIKENVIKEVKEEAGLNISADFIIAIQDRDKHNQPKMLHKVCKTFIYCTALGGEFQLNNETLASGYFYQDQLPPLSTEKNTKEQIDMCFIAHCIKKQKKPWITLFD